MLIREISAGIKAYGQALKFLSDHRLWAYMVLPALLSLFLGIGIFLAAWGLSDNIGQAVLNLYPWERGREIVGKIASVAGGILLIAGGLFLYKNLVLILAGPFMSPLSEKVERILAGSTREVGFSPTRLVSDFVRGLRIALRNIVRELFFTIVLLLLGLIPIFAPFTAAGIFLVQAYYAGFGNLDFLLERHFKVSGSVRFVRANRGLALGNGIVFIGLLFTGVGFLFAPTLGAVAATLEGVKRLETHPAA